MGVGNGESVIVLNCTPVFILPNRELIDFQFLSQEYRIKYVTLKSGWSPVFKRGKIVAVKKCEKQKT